MRSRYSAFVLHCWDYLQETWHKSTRPIPFSPMGAELPAWLGLEVLSQEWDPQSDEAYVEFKAFFRHQNAPQALHEKSRFLRENGRWYYLDGEQYPVPPGALPTRNAPCPCGSGKKFKRCCGQ